MEAVEEAPPCHVISNDLSPVAKGKRTKRHRPHSPIPSAVSSHRGSSAEDSPTAEEEETARCLILLSQGPPPSPNWNQHEPKPANRAAGCMYACKTCGREFPSFQALGGHRTSHKKPKNEKRTSLFSGIDEDYPSPSSRKRIPPPPSLSLQLSSTSAASPSPRVHECSYCGAEFTSGQALGGHMRRHRAGPISPLPSPSGPYIGPERPEPVPKKARNGLCLDLNFPAPEDENRRSGYESGQQKGPEKLALSITTPTLVDCHF